MHDTELYLLSQIKKQIQYVCMTQNCIFFYKLKANTTSMHDTELYLLLQIKKQIQYVCMTQNCIFFCKLKSKYNI